ncbi:MAG: TIGR02466 family protein [Alphaproteobacteria bacterium]
MAPTREWQEGFVDLWPITMIQRRPPGHEGPTRELLSLVRELERANRNLTTDYRAPDLFNTDHPGVNWLRAQVNDTTIAYLRRLGIDYPVNWLIQGWPNVNRFGDYHDAHNHPRAYLSGTYYVKVPVAREKLKNRNDLRPGCITFYDPRPGINMTAIKGDPYVDPEYTVRPEPGMLLMWPAFLNHFVHPNLSKQPRVSISFNIVLKWSDDYLPEQG